MSLSYSELTFKLETFLKKLGSLSYKLNLLKTTFSFDIFLKNQKNYNKKLNDVNIVELYQTRLIRALNVLVKVLTFSFSNKNLTAFVQAFFSETKLFLVNSPENITKNELEYLENLSQDIQIELLQISDVFRYYENSFFMAHFRIKNLTRKGLHIKIKTPGFLKNSIFLETEKKKINVYDFLSICKEEFSSTGSGFENLKVIIGFVKISKNKKNK